MGLGIRSCPDPHAWNTNLQLIAVISLQFILFNLATIIPEYYYTKRDIMNITLIIPVYNEVQAINSIIDRVIKFLNERVILIVY